ncbi:hypothetical protein C8R45DRAFT_1070196 [Mycena sanguinolenta]|nr:hypothetical protein C8R45DRAFT_1070196 [Mycena sanguinolenta]
MYACQAEDFAERVRQWNCDRQKAHDHARQLRRARDTLSAKRAKTTATSTSAVASTCACAAPSASATPSSSKAEEKKRKMQLKRFSIDHGRASTEFLREELKPLKGNLWSRGGVPTGVFGLFGGGGGFSKSIKQGTIYVSIRSAEIGYSKTTLKCTLKFEVVQMDGGSRSKFIPPRLPLAFGSKQEIVALTALDPAFVTKTCLSSGAFIQSLFRDSRLSHSPESRCAPSLILMTPWEFLGPDCLSLDTLAFLHDLLLGSSQAKFF